MGGVTDKMNVYIATFNCARTPIDIDYFAATFFHGFKGDFPPDLIVLSLQEVAPIAYSFLSASYLEPYYARFVASVSSAALSKFGDFHHVTLTKVNVGMVAIMVLARQDVLSRIRRVEVGGVGVGLWEMGNKGAVGVRLRIAHDGEDAAVTFVAAHLAPMEEAWTRRNEDWKSICERLVFEKDDTAHRSRPVESEPLLSGGADDVADDLEEHSLFQPPTYIFVAGDLNYRASDSRPGPESHKSWPQPVAPKANAQHFSELFSHDQLTRERDGGATLHGLAEAPVTFPPTYKYSHEARRRAANVGLREPESNANGVADVSTSPLEPLISAKGHWASHRTPSWCDRILFLDSAQVETSDYTALPVQPTSDHRPVSLSVSLLLKPVETSIPPPFEVRKDWRERRQAAGRRELLVGLAAYLSLTWEGNALLTATVLAIAGLYIFLQAVD